MMAVAAGVLEVIGVTFRCPASSLSRATVAEDIDGWDSLSHAVLIMRIEQHFRVRLDAGAAFDVDNVGALIDLVAASIAPGVHPITG